MFQGITIMPVVVQSLHLVHELQTLTLVIVSCCKFDGDGVLIALQLDATTLVEGLCQGNIAIIGMTYLNFLFTNKQLG